MPRVNSGPVNSHRPPLHRNQPRNQQNSPHTKGLKSDSDSIRNSPRNLPPRMRRARVIKKSYGELWQGDVQQFQKTVEQLTTLEMAAFARQIPKDVALNQPKKLQLFYQQVSAQIKKDKTGMGVEWLADCYKPLADGVYFNLNLTNTVFAGFEHFWNQSPPSHREVERMMEVSASVLASGCWHGFIARIVQDFCGRISTVDERNFILILSGLRTSVMLHSALLEGNRVHEEVEQNLKLLLMQVQSFLESSEPELSYVEKTQLQWLEGYGRSVLNMHDLQLQGSMADTSKSIISQLHRNVAKGLRGRLPHLNIEVEKVLPNNGLSVDLFVEPNVVIEVDGWPYHYSEKLRLTDQDRPETRVNGKTLLKRTILKRSGYCVVSVAHGDDETLNNVARQVAKLTQ